MARGPVEVELPVQGAFSLAASTRFLEGFAPAGAFAAGEQRELALAFPVEGDWRTAGAVVREDGGRVVAEVIGAVEPAVVGAQLARILSLDVDGTGFPAVGARDPIVGALQQRYPGLRPVGFWSPYEAAAWAILSQRMRTAQAARVKQRLAERHGTVVDVGGRRLAALPAPRVLRGIGEIEGLPARKLPWLHGIADAALAGTLDAARLRALEPERALTELRDLPGIGPFGAELILIRGALHPDVFPAHERSVHAEVARAYQLDDPTPEQLEEIADRWRPYRSWVSLLLRTAKPAAGVEPATSCLQDKCSAS